MTGLIIASEIKKTFDDSRFKNKQNFATEELPIDAELCQASRLTKMQ